MSVYYNVTRNPKKLLHNSAIDTDNFPSIPNILTNGYSKGQKAYPIDNSKKTLVC